MEQPTKRYSTQDVWKSYWCGPTIFDRIGKDFDKSGYDLHWLRDALTSAYDVQESCRSSVNEKLRHPYTLSVLEKARLLCDAQDNRHASSIGIVDIAVLALSGFAVLASVISTYKDMNISQEIMPANLIQPIHNPLAISVQAASAVSDNSAAGGTADADAGNDDGDGDA